MPTIKYRAKRELHIEKFTIKWNSQSEIWCNVSRPPDGVQVFNYKHIVGLISYHNKSKISIACWAVW